MNNTHPHFFSKIANRYDLVTTLISLGTCNLWTRKAISSLLQGHTPHNVLDLCCGTGCMSKELLDIMGAHSLPPPTIDCVDFCSEMLKEAQTKLYLESALIRCIRSDASELPFADNSYDTVILGYGIRNIANPKKVLTEMSRVLLPKGRVCILELTRPQGYLSPFIHLYMRTIVPFIGAAVTRSWTPYLHFASSVYSLRASQLLKTFSAAGFKCIHTSSHCFGLITIIQAEKL